MGPDIKLNRRVFERREEIFFLLCCFVPFVVNWIKK